MHDGEGETVSGMVIITKGTNSRELIQGVKEKIAGIKLPDRVKIAPFYDQSDVIDGTIETVKHNLIEGSVLVIVVLLLFLGNWRAALMVAAVIPFSLLFGFMGMALFGISANLMSLGAVDFGMIVDGSVVMVENSRPAAGTSRRQPRQARNDSSSGPRGRAAHHFRRRDHHCGLSCRSSRCKGWKAGCSIPWQSPSAPRWRVRCYWLCLRFRPFQALF